MDPSSGRRLADEALHVLHQGERGQEAAHAVCEVLFQQPGRVGFVEQAQAPVAKRTDNHDVHVYGKTVHNASDFGRRISRFPGAASADRTRVNLGGAYTARLPVIPHIESSGPQAGDSRSPTIPTF